ncbi:hypothetical protein BHM03_00045200 [Ensete ventricosum]|nr:hypothetical protein BHM03_00045200 [Ensete ventricosum]
MAATPALRCFTYDWRKGGGGGGGGVWAWAGGFCSGEGEDEDSALATEMLRMYWMLSYHATSQGRKTWPMLGWASSWGSGSKSDNREARREAEIYSSGPAIGALETLGNEGDHGTRSNDGHEKAAFEALDFFSTLRDGSEEKPMKEQGKARQRHVARKQGALRVTAGGEELTVGRRKKVAKGDVATERSGCYSSG